MEIAMRLRALGSRFLVLALFCGCGSALAQSGADTALYWELSRDGQPAGFLLGTIHSEDPRVLEFPEAFIGQLKSNRAFAMEMVPDLPTLTRLTEYMHYQDGTLLEQRIGAERFARVRAALSDYRVPADWVARMKIWAAMMTLSVPPPRSGLFMDFSLSLRAAGSGLKVVGLETLEQQLSFLENMPEEQQLDLLDQALNEYESVQDVHDRMVASYLAGDLQALSRQVEEQLAELTPEARRYFMAEGIAARNGRMLDSLLPLLEEGRVFAAVGALHLPGETGLIAGLRRQGYELRPLPLPFSAAQAGRQATKQGSHETADAP
jgi:uncharacterized protein YbaP (TraB family)